MVANTLIGIIVTARMINIVNKLEIKEVKLVQA